jgi:hypothetical protein
MIELRFDSERIGWVPCQVCVDDVAGIERRAAGGEVERRRTE